MFSREHFLMVYKTLLLYLITCFGWWGASGWWEDWAARKLDPFRLSQQRSTAGASTSHSRYKSLWMSCIRSCRPSQARVLIRFALEMRSNGEEGRANLFFHTNLNCKLSLSYSLRSLLSFHVEGHPLLCVEFWVQIMRNWRWKVNRARIAWWFWEIQWKFWFVLSKM